MFITACVIESPANVRAILNFDLPQVRSWIERSDADQCVPVLLWLSGLRCIAATE